MSKSLRWIAALMLVFLFVGGMSAFCESLDDLPEVVSEYAKGKRLLREGSYLEASRVFLELAGRYPDSPNMDLFVFNRGKAEFYFGNFNEAQATFSDFTRRYTKSPNLAHGYFFLGNTQFLKGKLDRAVAAYVQAYRFSQDSRLSDLIISSLAGTIAGAKSVTLGHADFESLPQVERCEFISRLSQSLVARKAYGPAKDLMALCGETLEVPGVDMSQYSSRGGDLEIGVVLPFSGELQSFGEEIYNGAIVAAEAYRQETGGSINLVPFDTKGDAINAGRIIRELIHSSVDAVIGPLTSEEAAVGSAVLSCETLPMLAPAATQAGLTLLSESCFQLSPNVELQGIQMADYAVLNLKADSAAIITPTGADDLRMTRAFTQRFEELGGTVIATEYYRSRDTDFGTYIRDIKALLLGIHPDSSFFVDERGDTLDAEGVPAYVDCLFLPGKASQLRLLLPQINFYNLKGAYLGSDGWGDDAVYRLSDNVTKQAVFPSPFLQQRVSPEYVKFAAAYDRRYGKQPQRLASLGYDAVRVIAVAVRSGGGTRTELVAQLSRISGFQGAAATLTFGANRENVELPLYRVVDGGAEYLGEAAAASTVTEE